MELINIGTPGLRQVMDVLSVQQGVIAQNVANINTPGYIAHKLDFEQAMLKAMTDDSSAAAAQPRDQVAVEPDYSRPGRPDGNNVNLENEMIGLAQNSELYSALTKLANKDLRLARYVISGGRG